MLYHVHLAELPDTRTGATCQVKAYVTSPHFDYDASQVTDAFEFPLQLLDPQDTEDALLILGLFCGQAAQAEPLANASADTMHLPEWVMWFYSDTNTKIQGTITHIDGQQRMFHLFDLPLGAVLLANQARAWLARIKLGELVHPTGLDTSDGQGQMEQTRL